MNCLKEEKRKTEDGWESIQVAGFEKSLWEEGWETSWVVIIMSWLGLRIQAAHETSTRNQGQASENTGVPEGSPGDLGLVWGQEGLCAVVTVHPGEKPELNSGH